MKRGKKYVEAAKAVDRATLYDTAEAISLVKKAAVAKFDETIEVHIRTGCDGRHADQQIRGAVVLPHGTGKTVRVLVFAKDAKAEEAKAAGADFVGAEDLIPKIQNEGWLDFDVVVATPDMMGVVGRLGRVLGPKGLMPNPKAGTVTMDVTKAINDIKAGKIEYRLDKIVCHSLPIRPGRNLAVIVESAAVNHRQKKMGYNAAEELYKRVQANIAKKREE